jgi:hypothetical protein
MRSVEILIPYTRVARIRGDLSGSLSHALTAQGHSSRSEELLDERSLRHRYYPIDHIPV